MDFFFPPHLYMPSRDVHVVGGTAFFLSLLMVFNPFAYLWLLLIIFARIFFGPGSLLTLAGIG